MVEKPRSGLNKNTGNINRANHAEYTRQVSKPSLSSQSQTGRTRNNPIAQNNKNNQNSRTGQQVSGYKTDVMPDAKKQRETSRMPFGLFGKKRNVVELVRYREGVDRLFLILVIILLCLGTVMIFSASYANALQYYGNSYFFAEKQIMMAAIGIAVMIVTSLFADYTLIEKFAAPIFVVTFALNYITPFYGRLSHGATRWINIAGQQIQPSEFLKLAVVIFFAFYITKVGEKIKTFKWGIAFPVLIVLSLCGAMFMQSHLSGLIIITLICAAILFIGEAPKIFFITGASLAALAVSLIVNFNEKVVEILVSLTGKTYAGDRLRIWLDPFIDPRDKGHQIIQSLYAIGSGGLTGLGWGQSRQKFLYLPEPQNDFIFAIICEEMGFIGALLIIALFILLIWRGFVIAYYAPNKFSSLVVMGITIKVALQFLLNIAVVTNTVPTTGISLPFFSYGGTALIVLMAEMGIILSISRYSYQEKP